MVRSRTLRASGRQTDRSRECTQAPGRWARIKAVGGAALLAALLVPQVAHADARTDARRAFKTGMALIAKGKYDEGIKELEKANAIYPHPNVTYNIARAHAEAGNLEQAIAKYKEYATTEPADKATVLQTITQLEARVAAKKSFRAGIDLIQQGKYSDGIKELEKANTAMPSPNITYNIARAHAALGNLDQAVAAYKEYLKSEPPDKVAVQAVVSQLEEQIAAKKALAVTQPGDVKPGDVKPGDVPPGDVKPGDVKPGDVKPGDVKPGDVKPGDIKTDVKPGELKGEGKPGDDAKGIVGEAKTEDVFQETVVTASRGAQTPLDSPNSTAIITRQDIQLSGITKIPELLRRVAGMDVMQITGGDTNVGLRGFNSRLANKMLVLANGRSIYNDILGSTYWETLSIDVDQIERIEVVRGPGSALYGANAFSGVINIIPIAPGEGKSGVRFGIGDQLQGYGSAWVTGKQGDIAYRASAGYTRYPRWTREVSDTRDDLVVQDGVDQNLGSQNFRLDLRTSTKIDATKRFNVGGSYSRADIDTYGIGPFNNIALNFETADATAAFESDFLNVRAYYVRLNAKGGLNSAYEGHTLYPTQANQNTLNGEIEFVRKFNAPRFMSHDLHAGIGYRLKDVSWNYLIDNPPDEHWGSLFLLDTIGFNKYVSLALSGRLDYVPYLQRVVPSGRASLIIKPTEQQAIRLSGSNAFRTPTFLESYLNLPVEVALPGVELLSASNSPDRPGFILEPEQVTTVEASYLNQQSDVFEFEVNAYYNRVSNLTRLDVPRFVSLSGINDGQGGVNVEEGRYTVAYGGWLNNCDVYHVVGGELGARVYPVEGLDLFANYAINFSSQEKPETCKLIQDERTSNHKINAGVQLRTKFGLSGELSFHYQTSQIWTEQVTTLTGIEERQFPIGDYALVNARVGYRFFKDRFEVSGTVFNAFADVGGPAAQHHPFGNRVGRRFMGFLSYSL
ncbi:MAG: TonB-dependent receptor plug domain-containing protein [Polyangiaceae bacterium]|nr:TonB-dependent receptor plug domain-containing protein [Polyangiaceae bacterium]